MNAQLQKIQAKIEELHTKFFPVVKFLKKKNLKLKYARVQDRQVQFFRIDDFQKIVKDNIQQIKKILSTEGQVQKQLTQSFYYLARPVNSKPLKYPSILQFSKEETQFASFKFPIQQSKKWLMFLIIAAILFLVLFPVWPYELKYYIWLISLYLLIFLTGLIIVRYILFSLFSVLGVSFWLFPNLLADSSVIQSFKPLYSIEKWEKSTLNLFFRISMFIGLTIYAIDIYNDPSSMLQNFQITKEAVKDVHDWGVSKIKGQTNFSQRALTNLADILNQTKEVQETETLNNNNNIQETQSKQYEEVETVENIEDIQSILDKSEQQQQSDLGQEVPSNNEENQVQNNQI